MGRGFGKGKGLKTLWDAWFQHRARWCAAWGWRWSQQPVPLGLWSQELCSSGCFDAAWSEGCSCRLQNKLRLLQGIRVEVALSLAWPLGEEDLLSEDVQGVAAPHGIACWLGGVLRHHVVYCQVSLQLHKILIRKFGKGGGGGEQHSGNDKCSLK